jgi:uncharacterized membrane protein
MRKFSFRPSITLKGREFRGLRGFAGKPFHPPLTDVPVTAYLFGAAFDLISRLGRAQPWSHDFYRAASFTLIGGAAVSLLTALTGFWDWLKSTEKGNQARRTVNAHAWTMITVTLIVLADLAWRWFKYWGYPFAPWRIVVLSIVAAALVTFGATIGGELVYDYGFNVEMVGEVWEPSERDVFPADRAGEHPQG